MFRLLGFLVFSLVVLVVGVNMLGHWVLANSIESAIGLKTSVQKVHLDFLNQQASIYGIRLKNPEGFQQEKLADIPEISVQLDLAALLKRQIHLRQVRINLDEVTVERNAEGKFNLVEITRKQKEPDSEESSETKPEPEKTPKDHGVMEWVIDEVQVSMGRAKYYDYSNPEMTSKEFPLEVKGMVLKDVHDPKQVVDQIVIKTMQKVGLNALVPDWGQLMAALPEDASQMIHSIAEKFGFNFAKS